MTTLARRESTYQLLHYNVSVSLYGVTMITVASSTSISCAVHVTDTLLPNTPSSDTLTVNIAGSLHSEGGIILIIYTLSYHTLLPSLPPPLLLHYNT